MSSSTAGTGADRVAPGRTPASWIGSAEPIWIIVLSPLFAVMWTKLGTRAPSTPMKFAIGIVGMGVCVPAVPHHGRQHRPIEPRDRRLRDPGPFRDVGADALADRAFCDDEAGARRFPRPDGGAVLLLRGPGHVHVRGAWRFYSADNEYAYFGINGAVVIVIGLILAALTPWIRRMMEGVH